MAGPFIFIATNRLKPGKLEDEKKRVPDFVDFIRANEPRLIAFNEYAARAVSDVHMVQVVQVVRIVESVAPVPRFARAK